MSTPFLVSGEPLAEHAVTALVTSPDAGGVVTFVGRVRDYARGRTVTALEYEAYAAMAESVFAQIAAEATARFAVVVAVSAAHRGPAFSACEYIVDQLKTRAPIWKKEFGLDGAVWVEEHP